MSEGYPHIFLNWCCGFPVSKRAGNTCLFFAGQMALSVLVALNYRLAQYAMKIAPAPYDTTLKLQSIEDS